MKLKKTSGFKDRVVAERSWKEFLDILGMTRAEFLLNKYRHDHEWMLDMMSREVQRAYTPIRYRGVYLAVSSLIGLASGYAISWPDTSLAVTYAAFGYIFCDTVLAFIWTLQPSPKRYGLTLEGVLRRTLAPAKEGEKNVVRLSATEMASLFSQILDREVSPEWMGKVATKSGYQKINSKYLVHRV